MRRRRVDHAVTSNVLQEIAFRPEPGRWSRGNVMLEEALRSGKPEVFNTDQGVQFTAAAFIGRLESAGVAVSMDGRGRALDNVFVERL